MKITSSVLINLIDQVNNFNTQNENKEETIQVENETAHTMHMEEVSTMVTDEAVAAVASSTMYHEIGSPSLRQPIRGPTTNENDFEKMDLSKELQEIFASIDFTALENRQPSLPSRETTFSSFLVNNPPTKEQEEFKGTSVDNVLSALPSSINELKKPHPLIEHLHDLPPLSPQFDNRMAIFNTGVGISEEAFIKGVEIFTEIANLEPSERKKFFGSKYRGLHYGNDLATLWNQKSGNLPIKARQLASLIPLSKKRTGVDWDSQVIEGKKLLVFRGDKPSKALDALLAGPAVIDCGMFCQLGLWFGVRAMVGDEKFDRLFGRAPFFLTQFSFKKHTRFDGMQEGNPLFPFLRFDDESEKAEKSEKDSLQVGLRYFPNVDDYKIKHLGGTANGQNALSVRGKFTIFDPTSRQEKKSQLAGEEVFEALRGCYNAPHSQDVHNEISNCKEHPDVIHPLFGIPLGMVGILSDGYSDKTLEKEEFFKEVSSKRSSTAIFDFKKFQGWLTEVEAQAEISSHAIVYQPFTNSMLQVSEELKREIPHENREQMSFESFNRKNQVQEQLYNLALFFCQKVSNHEEIWLTLSGNAGIGKTASAVACAKELTSRGTRVLWISESTVSRWTEACLSMEEIGRLNHRIREKLELGYDVVILDDNNLAGTAGTRLLEEIYKWYCEKPSRAVLVTSNVEVSFKECFGLKLEGYHVPPFLPYDSHGFIHQHLFSLSAESQRPAQSHAIHALSSEEKLAALHKKNLSTEDRSIGAILSKEAYQKALGTLIDEIELEVIPSFSPSWQSDILMEAVRRGCYYATATDSYKALTPLQKKWTYSYPIDKCQEGYGGIRFSTGKVERMGVAMNPFSSTEKKSVVVELLEDMHWSGKKTIIDEDGFAQLLRVIHHCFDSGGKKLMIVNSTNFPDDQLLEKILEQLPESEKERLSARIKDMLLGWKV